MRSTVVTLDVREDLQRGREPFSKIMGAAASLKENQDLLLIAPFEPAPLFPILAQQGFTHETKSSAEGKWEILFSRKPAKPAVPAPPSKALPKPAGACCTGTPVVRVDTRGLEPPEPLVRILEALAALPEGAALEASTDRRPMHLYSQLDERGFVGETREQNDGSFLTYVRRR